MTLQLTRTDWQQRLDSLAPRTGVFIDGEFRDARAGATFSRPRPFDGQPGHAVARGTAEDIAAAVASGKRAFADKSWRGKDPAERKAIMLRWAALVRENAEELALLETADVGKPISDALNVDVKSCANTLQFYGEMVDKLYDEVAPTGPNDRAIVKKEPL